MNKMYYFDFFKVSPISRWKLQIMRCMYKIKKRNSHHIGVNYSSVIMRVGASLAMSLLCPTYWSKMFLFILNWKCRYLSWVGQYQTGIFVWIKQCYGDKLTQFASYSWNCPPPLPIMIRFKKYLSLICGTFKKTFIFR